MAHRAAAARVVNPEPHPTIATFTSNSSVPPSGSCSCSNERYFESVLPQHCSATATTAPALSTAGIDCNPPATADTPSSIISASHAASKPSIRANEASIHTSAFDGPPVEPSQAAILDHLGRDFSDPVSFLAGMTKANMLLSGSRVLEIFLPGSCEENSDWDCYCQGSARSVGQAIVALKQAGVVFDCPFKLMTDIALASHGSVITINADTHRTLSSYARSDLWSGKVPVLASAVMLAIGAALSENKHCKAVPLSHGVLVRIRHGKSSHDYENGDGYMPGLKIITGSTTHGETPRKVQLISAARKSPLSHIFDFYSTCSQVVITGLGAIMFHWHGQRDGIYLSSNTQHKDSAEAATRKYARRGFKFTMPTSTDYIVKHLGTPGHGASVVVFDGIPLGVSPDLYAVRLAHFKNLAWSEYAGETRLLQTSTFEMKAVLKRNRNARIALRAAGMWDDTDLVVAQSHTAAYAGSRHSYPDEVIGL
ncbi:uncharacterized protein RCC_02274 [Ramularia collo-cygni]|uniref:Uncharacterized protein n=1 Tax=Ramularia collo-cygni TaxID=112498 RepID=A0A2D3UNI1_9PEZI|nr:uncharacterized protein RCC_02274 [Ramularia collo-cygni]CZT16431.1 uncharacterized protein RCC_02274 [Ramularia collo-cygni]